MRLAACWWGLGGLAGSDRVGTSGDEGPGSRGTDQLQTHEPLCHLHSALPSSLNLKSSAGTLTFMFLGAAPACTPVLGWFPLTAAACVHVGRGRLALAGPVV